MIAIQINYANLYMFFCLRKKIIFKYFIQYATCNTIKC
jgi:hypothetical protein